VTAPPVLLDVEDGVARLTLNRPHVLKGLDTSLSAVFAECAGAASAARDVVVVVVRGAGRAFCSGMDRTALAAGSVDESFFRHWTRALNCLEDMPKIAVAVLHGHSIGGGLQLALACDLRIATTDAVLGLGATRHALVPDGAVLRLARVIGLGRAKELALLNDRIPPAEARAVGLVNWVCAPADLEATVEGVIDKARQAAPTATAHTKRLLQESFHADPRALIEEVVRAQRACLTSWEIVEANRAWQERREAVFSPPPADREELERRAGGP
jgi:enoyl-CoA hydratase/carnithine racemase